MSDQQNTQDNFSVSTLSKTGAFACLHRRLGRSFGLPRSCRCIWCQGSTQLSLAAHGRRDKYWAALGRRQRFASISSANFKLAPSHQPPKKVLPLRVSSTMATRCTPCSKLHISRLFERARLSQHRGSPAVIHNNHLFCRHHRSLEDLNASAKQGCDFCHFLQHYILSHTQERKGQIGISLHPQTGSTGIAEDLLVRIGHETVHLKLLTDRGSVTS